MENGGRRMAGRNWIRRVCCGSQSRGPGRWPGGGVAPSQVVVLGLVWRFSWEELEF